MVDFIVFNELSLPLCNMEYEAQLLKFFELVAKLKSKYVSKLKMSMNFKEYQILSGIYLQEFFGKIKDRDLNAKLKAFITGDTLIAKEHPLIFDDELSDEILENYTYDFKELSLDCGIVCANIFETATISFATDVRWDTDFIKLQKNGKEIDVMHASETQHLKTHQHLWDDLSNLNLSKFTPRNLYDLRDEIFTCKVRLCEDLKKNLPNLDIHVFKIALARLMDIDQGKKNISDFKNISSLESETVRNDSKLRSMREFFIGGKKVFFSNHMKLFDGYRMYYHEIFCNENKSYIYIGYLGPHLPTKNY